MRVMSDILKTFAENLVRLRAERGMSQAELADRAGLSHTTVSRYESQKQAFRKANLEALAQALDCSTGELLDEPGAMQPKKPTGKAWQQMELELAQERNATLQEKIKFLEYKMDRYSQIDEQILMALSNAPEAVLGLIRAALGMDSSKHKKTTQEAAKGSPNPYDTIRDLEDELARVKSFLKTFQHDSVQAPDVIAAWEKMSVSKKVDLCNYIRKQEGMKPIGPEALASGFDLELYEVMDKKTPAEKEAHWQDLRKYLGLPLKSNGEGIA